MAKRRTDVEGAGRAHARIVLTGTRAGGGRVAGTVHVEAKDVAVNEEVAVPAGVRDVTRDAGMVRAEHKCVGINEGAMGG